MLYLFVPQKENLIPISFISYAMIKNQTTDTLNTLVHHFENLIMSHCCTFCATKIHFYTISITDL